MHLWIAIHLPLLPLEVFYPHCSSESGQTAPAAAVLEHARVFAMSRAAADAGVRYGMRRGGVLAVLPQVRLHERATALEKAHLLGVALALLQYTPHASLSGEHTILLDIGASLRLFGGIRALCRRIRQTLRQLSVSGCISCAPSAAGAVLLAQQGGTRTLRLQHLQRHLDHLPCHALPTLAPCLEWLTALGCRRLAELRRLPRDGLLRRGGNAMQQALRTLDHAYGVTRELHDWIVPPPSFARRAELSERVEHSSALLHVAHTLILQLCGWLAARQLAVTQVQLQLEHERGRQAQPPTSIDLLLATPAWEDTHLLRLLRERLARLPLPAPVIAVSLDASHTTPMAAPNNTLLPEPGGTPADHQRLLELLVARLGPERVRHGTPLADHRPELANHWDSVITPAIPARAAGIPQAVTLPPRPLWLLTQPLALRLRDHRPWYGSPLRLLSPPERIEAGWWHDQFVTRDYYVAAASNHCHYWIYRERIGDVEGADAHWYLHGLFG